MNLSLRKISLFIIAIIILPALIFSVYEIGNFRENEKVIQNIYKNQLDAILFSINQYSDDIISNLASRIENGTENYHGNSYKGLEAIIKDLPSLKHLIQFDNDFTLISSVPYSYHTENIINEIRPILDKNSRTINQVETYMKGGYRKIVPLEESPSKTQLILFITRLQEKEIINILIIDPDKFISQVLDPKIQEVTKGKFDIAAYHTGENYPFYASNKQLSMRKISSKEPFWLLPRYLMGIELKNLTITDMSRERSQRNLIIIGIMDVILVVGAWLIIRNISKQFELSQLKSDFVSNVSHEIRTPLALITMYIETLEMGRVKDKEKIKEYYSIILNETTRLSGIVNRILSFSQIERDKRKYYFSVSDLNEIVENAVATFKYNLESKGFSYTFVPDNDLPQTLLDRDAVSEAFINLIDNALKYSDEIKQIIVRTGQYENNIFVEVEDHGIGISDKNLKYIFDKFYRVTETNIANKVKGSGLGLAIVKHIMDAHNGSVDVESTQGSGSKFKLSFPVTQNE